MKKRIALAAVAALAGGLLVAAPASATTSVTLSQTALRAGQDASVTVTLGSAVPSADSGTAKVAIRIDAAPTGGYNAGANATAGTSGLVRSSSALLTDATSATVSWNDDAGTNGTVDNLADAILTTAGSYAVTVWYDKDGNETLGVGEAYAASTIVVGGTPATIALSASTSTAVEGVSTPIFTTSAKDSAGNATALKSGEQLNLASTRTSAAGTYTLSAAQTTLGEYSISPVAGNAGTYTITVSPGGSLPGTIAQLTHTLTISAAAATAPTDFSVVETADVLAVTTTAGARTYDMNTARTTFSVKMTGATASSAVVIYVSDGSANGTDNRPSALTINGTAVTSADNRTAGTAVYAGMANASGELTVTVSTTDTSLNTNAVAIANAADWTNAGTKKVTITWATAVPAASESLADIVVAPGSAVNLTATVADQYSNPVAGYVVTGQTIVTTAGTGGPAVGTLGTIASGVTGADGKVTLSLAAPAGSVTGTVANARYSVTTNTGAALTVAVSNTVAAAVSYVTGAAVTSVTLSANDFDADGVSIAAGQTIVVPADGVPSGAAGANTAAAATDDVVKFEVSSSPATYITVTGDAGLFFSTTAPTTWKSTTTSVNVASGSDVYVWATKPGTYKVTATAGGQSASGYIAVTHAGTGSARNVALALSASTIAAGSYGVGTITVTDAFGNAVPTTASALKVEASGSVLLQGSALTLDTTAGTDGTVKFTYVGGASTGTGSIKVTGVQANTNQFSAAAGYAQGSATVTNAGAAGAGVLGADLPASVGTASVSTTGAAAAADPTQAAAISALQTSVAALQTTVASLVASITAQIKAINSALVKIARNLKIKL